MGRTRFLLVALLGVLATPASAFAGTCLDATTGVATDVQSGSATITGSIDPRGQPASYRFDLGPTIAYGSSTPTRALTVTTPTTVSEKLAALTPGTTYHFRLVGITACGSEAALDATFTTPLAPGQQPLAVVPLVFTSWASGNAEVDITGSDGNGVRDLSNSPASDFDPALSPDGGRVVFTSTRSGNGDLYVVNQDGSGLTQLTRSRYSDSNPAWSPDGKSIVFASGGPGGPGLFVINADGTRPQAPHARQGRRGRSRVVAERGDDRVRAHRQGHRGRDLHRAGHRAGPRRGSRGTRSRTCRRPGRRTGRTSRGRGSPRPAEAR